MALTCLVLLQVLKAVLLFPTIERMAQSPQGKVMTPVLCQLRYLAYLPLFLLSLLPQRVAALLVRLLLRGLPALDPCVLRPALQMFSGDCAGGFCWVLPGLCERSATFSASKSSGLAFTIIFLLQKHKISANVKILISQNT